MWKRILTIILYDHDYNIEELYRISDETCNENYL